MKRLTINGQVADISELPSAISFKYVDIIDGLSNRYSPFTSGITLPYTARNKSIFGYSDVVGGSKKVNPNLILDGYRMYSSSENVGGVNQTTTMQLTAGKTYTFSVKGSKASAAATSRIYVDRIISGVRWAKDLELPVSGIKSINSITFVCPDTGEYGIGYWFQSSSLCVVDWLMIQEGNVYVDQNTQFKQTAEEAVANLENLLENSVSRSYTAPVGQDFVGAYIAVVNSVITQPNAQNILQNGKLYTLSFANVALSSGTLFSIRIYNFTDGTWDNSPLINDAVPVGNDVSVRFRLPADGKNYGLVIYYGVRGATGGKTITLSNLMLQYGPFSTKWYKYGITPTVIPISAERGVSMVDMFIGGMKVIDQGSLSVDSMDADGYHCTVTSRNTLIDSIDALTVEDVMDEIQGDADIFSSRQFGQLLPFVADGSFGILLARDLQEDITSTTWNVMDKQVVKSFIHHWLWFSIKKLFSTLEATIGFSFYFTEGGALVDLDTSTLVDTYFTKLWTPGFAYFVDMDTGTGECFMGKDVSATNQFHFGTEDEVPRSTFKAFGNKTAWEMVKIVSNMFCCGLKVSPKDSTIIFYPLDEIKNFDSIDLSGRLTERPEKVPFVDGYTSTSRIRFTVSDNAPEDYNEIVLTSPKLPAETTDLFTFDLLVPGLYYNAILDDNVFKINLAANDMLNSVPLILYQNGDVETTTVEYAIPGTTYSYSVDLEKLRMLDLSTFHTDLQAWLTKGLVYNIKIAISIYDYLKLQPYRFVRIKELGGDYYLNKIDKWNPDKEAKMQLIKADTAVVKVMPTLIWNTPSDIYYGTALSSTQLNCTADVAGVFTYTPAVGEVLNAGTHTLSATFVPTDTDAYEIAYKTVLLLVNKVAATVTWATPSAITYGTALSGTQLNATANVPGSFVYDPPAGTILNAGTNNLDVTFTPFDTTNYIGTSKSVNISVAKATPVITWGAPAAISWGTVLSGTQLNASTGVAGTFTYSPAAGTTLEVGSHTLGVTFTPSDGANYTGNTKSVNLVVNKATPVITWANPSAITYGTVLGGAQLNATSNVPGTFVYSPAAGATLNAGTQSLGVIFTPTDTAHYNGNTKSVSLVVNKATPVITWANPSAITYGTPLSSTQLNATANTPGAFTYNPTFGATPNAGTNTLNVSFVPTDTANWNNTTDTASLVINKANPTLSSWVPSPTDIDNGSNWVAGQLNASFSVAGTVTYKYYGTSDPVTAGTTLAIGIEEEIIVLQAHLAPTDSTNYNAVDLPQLGRTFDVNQARCTLDPDYNNEDGAITFVGAGQHSESITLETTEGYVLSLESGSGFIIKVNNVAVSLPYNGSAGSPVINISGSFSALDKTEVFKITPSSGYALVPIYLTCKYFEDPEHEL